MSVAGGLNSQLGLVAETTPGVATTVSRFYDFGQEGVKQTIDQIKYQALRPTRRYLGNANMVQGKIGVTGDLELPVMTKGFGLVFKHCLGTVATSTPGGATLTRDHKCTVGPLDGLAWTVQVGRTDVGGTTRAFTYSGCKVASWELKHDLNSMLMCTLTLDAMSEVTNVGLASASYPTAIVPFAFTRGVISVAGTEVPIIDWDLKTDNNLATDRYFIRSTTPATKKEQLEGAGIRTSTGNLTAEFTDLTLYNLFVSGTQSSITLVYTGTTAIESTFFPTITITIDKVVFTGETPTVDGPDLLKQSLPFEVVDATAADGPVAITVRTSDTLP